MPSFSNPHLLVVSLYVYVILFSILGTNIWELLYSCSHSGFPQQPSWHNIKVSSSEQFNVSVTPLTGLFLLYWPQLLVMRKRKCTGLLDLKWYQEGEALFHVYVCVLVCTIWSLTVTVLLIEYYSLDLLSAHVGAHTHMHTHTHIQ